MNYHCRLLQIATSENANLTFTSITECSFDMLAYIKFLHCLKSWCINNTNNTILSCSNPCHITTTCYMCYIMFTSWMTLNWCLIKWRGIVTHLYSTNEHSNKLIASFFIVHFSLDHLPKMDYGFLLTSTCIFSGLITCSMLLQLAHNFLPDVFRQITGATAWLPKVIILWSSNFHSPSDSYL